MVRSIISARRQIGVSDKARTCQGAVVLKAVRSSLYDSDGMTLTVLIVFFVFKLLVVVVKIYLFCFR